MKKLNLPGELEKYELTRYNTSEYLGKRTFTAIPDHIRIAIIKKMKELKYPAYSVYGVYSILYSEQDAFNNADLPIREKCNMFFGASERAIMPIFEILEKQGFLIQAKKGNKVVYIVQYPEYIENFKESEYIEIKSTKTKTDRKRIILEEEHEEKDEFSIKIKRTDLKQLASDYYEWNNKQPNRTKLERKEGFIRKYVENPDDYNISDYMNYLEKEKENKQKVIEAKKVEDTKNKERENKENKLSKIKSGLSQQELDKLFQECLEKIKKENPSVADREFLMKGAAEETLNKMLLEKYQ